jgi:hypothetical protein
MRKDVSKASFGGEGKKNRSGALYSTKDIEYIKNHYKTTPVDTMAKTLGRTSRAIQRKMSDLGLSVPKSERRKPYVWTDDDISFLKKSHKKMSDAEIATLLGINRISVLRKRKKLGLPAYKCQEYKRKGYKQINVDGKKVWIHRYVVAKSIGRPLRKKERVHHIDLDKTNNDIENLYLCKNEREHTEIHWNLNKVASDLVKKKLIIFDNKKGEYLLSTLLEELHKMV